MGVARGRERPKEKEHRCGLQGKEQPQQTAWDAGTTGDTLASFSHGLLSMHKFSIGRLHQGWDFFSVHLMKLCDSMIALHIHCHENSQNTKVI